jgi:hypothetical protein
MQAKQQVDVTFCDFYLVFLLCRSQGEKCNPTTLDDLCNAWLSAEKLWMQKIQSLSESLNMEILSNEYY